MRLRYEPNPRALRHAGTAQSVHSATVYTAHVRRQRAIPVGRTALFDSRGAQLNQLKWGVVLSYLSMGLGVLVSLAYMPFMLRLLGQSEWGLYSLVASIVGYLPVLSLGLGSAYMRYHTRAAAGHRDEVARLNGLFLAVFAAIGVVAAIVGTVLAANIGTVLGHELTSTETETARVLMGVMTFTVALSFPASVFSSFVTANERFIFQRSVSVIRMVVTPAATLLVLLAGHKSIGMALVAAGVAVAVTVADVAYGVRRLGMRVSFKRLDFALLGEIAIFSSFIFINMITDQVNWNVDKFILGHVGGTVLVAVYALAAQLNAYYISLSTAVSSVFIPRVNRLAVAAGDDRELTRLFTRVGRVQFMILALVCTGLVIFGRQFINLWAGPDYVGAYPVLLLLAIPVTIPLVQNLGIEIQRAKNLHKFRSWLYLGIAVVNVGVSIPLAQRYGAVGAAMGTAGALLIGNGLIMNFYYHKRVGIDMGYFWKAIAGFAPALAAAGTVGAATMRFANTSSVSGLLVWGLVYVGAYGVSMWFLGMNSSERELLRRPVMRLRARWRTTVG